MTIFFPDSRSSNHAILFAIALSFAIHVIAILKLPNIEFDKQAISETLVVEITPPQKPVPQPKPEPLPEPAKPEVKHEKTTPKPPPLKQPTIAPAVSLPAEPVASPPPQVIAVAPKAEVQPTFVAPAPEPVKPPPAPSPQESEAGIAQYLRLIAPELQKNQHYPAIARTRGWTGVTKLEIHLDSTGKLLSSEIKETSGYSILDKQALELVRKTIFPPPPEAVINRNIIIPINFDLKPE